jgi:TonB family protein
VVMTDGTVSDPKLIRGLPDDELNQRALAAILKWTFKPGMKDGREVPVIALFTVTYRIH